MADDNLKIITTEDGSSSIYRKDLNETYHSFHGAIQESRHVFIENGLNYRRVGNESSELSVLEIGFGTGLNALLTVKYSEDHHQNIHYTTLEPFPLSAEHIDALNYPQLLNFDGAKDLFQQLHQSMWETKFTISPCFSLLKTKTSLQNFSSASMYDVVFFDAFAPNKQMEMWELDMLQKVANMMADGGVFVTYCARGQLKRDLQSLGLTVETLPGPPGKKEMVRAIKS